MRFAIKTFGCKVNQYESDAIVSALTARGAKEAASEADADVLIINSCTVTEEGDKKAIRAIRRLRRLYPAKAIVLTGCFPQAFPEEAACSGADLVTGTARRAALPEMIERLVREKDGGEAAIAPPSATFEELSLPQNKEKTRAFLKVEDGCDRFCTYCIIPKARGRVRSRDLASIRAEAERFVREGRREIVLIGINLSRYGADCGLTLADAVETVGAVEGVDRVRLSSLEPELLTEEILTRFVASEKLCPHFHLSLQSGCDETLRRMGRRYTTAEYFALTERLRALFPNCAVTTDIMAGFAGETEEEFARSLAFAERVGFAKIHAFAYSLRKGTAAERLPDHVPEAVKAERFRRLSALDARLHAEFLKSQIGTTQTVLIQKRTSPDYVAGLTPNYTSVRLYGSNAARNALVTVKITQAAPDHCVGEEIV
ncbi:MAG: tRNA (N(6)-L-threonylcarbamoyladenosine(37)-C(2))-methylthiotransferase MtaB [Bacteroides sp.]|nr:tRNA (N(6)-L-threonylcarbamoyladenosine(37)-C(2))-methylthiotransferase MtaB [Eubacterium sp.]MCM1418815.1 tRNA (N(6)-L-threonylcarbamoyladenosine(37)-C(2))-methylthiotransferase MtaB [Roseburia sp.]MCM1462088.1 tRNA (N(6)-L-threonylcarbamoyladenosine(37)-C(2))-methylthiotransferase MtaB [Bacteroides sp.]